jgi:BON domain
MDTSLQSVNLTADELNRSLGETQEGEEGLAEQEQHIHLPNPSLWPLVLSAGILITTAGLLFIPDNPWLAATGVIVGFVGILGLGLEDPMGVPHAESEQQEPRKVYAPSEELLEQAQEVVDRLITISSTAYSTHPVKVEIEGEGLVLALYGKVELEAQKNEIEAELRKLPFVSDVRNFIVAEDEILNIAYKRIDDLRAAGKLEGAKDIKVFVENYILHIYGDVPSKSMMQLLERELIGIPGVRVVVNHIGLNTEIPGNLGKTRNKI